MMSQRAHFIPKLATRLLLAVSLSLLSACEGSMEDVCSSYLPKLDKRMDSAIVSLRPWTPQRGLASEGSVEGYLELSPRDRKSWKTWVESRLGEAQSSLDWIDGQPDHGTRLAPVRLEIVQIANL